MNPLLEQLHDIEGLDSISHWPLAIGWWVIIVLVVIAVGALIWYGARWIAFKRSWKSDTYQKLAILEKNLSEMNSRDTAIALSEYLRRIVLRRFPRKECAGLMGDAWLKWLTAHDPKEFDWEKKGTLLIEVPYAPAQSKIPVNQIQELIHAVRNWVR